MFLDIQKPGVYCINKRLDKNDCLNVVSDCSKNGCIWHQITLKNIGKKYQKKANCQHSLADAEAQSSHPTQFLGHISTVSCLQSFSFVLTTRPSAFGRYLFIWFKDFKGFFYVQQCNGA